MLPSDDPQLKAMLQQQSAQILQETIAPGGQVSAEKLASLERLVKLRDLLKSATPLERKRWPAAVLLLSTLALLSILLFFHVSQTDIEGDLMVSGVTFTSPSQQLLLDLSQAASIGVSGLKGVSLPQSVQQQNASAAHAIRITGRIALAPFTIPAGTRLSLRTTELPNQARLTFQGKNLQFRVNVTGAVKFSAPGIGVGEHSFPVPEAIILQAGDEDVDLDLDFGAVPFSLEPQLAFTNLSFLKIEQFTNENHTFVRSRSTILSGTLFFESLGDKSRTLRPGEVIRFEKAHGEIRTLGWRDRQLALRFHGAVERMTSGAPENTKNVMPTYLEWLQASHAPALLWASTLYLFGILYGALKWWKPEV